MTEPLEHHVVDGKNDPAANYRPLSLVLHWLGALAVIVLFFTHEGEWLNFHTALGVLLAVPLVFRVIYRWSKGFPRSHDQHPGLNFLARSVMVAMLVAIFTVTITGILLPFFEGTAYPMFGLGAWTAPYAGNTLIHGFLEEAHDVAGHAFIPLVVLHLIGFAKHAFIDKHGNTKRMLKPLDGGK